MRRLQAQQAADAQIQALTQIAILKGYEDDEDDDELLLF
jgi:hypothetical protein